MPSINLIQAKPFTLLEPIGTSDTEISVKNFVTIYGEQVEMSGTEQYTTLEPTSLDNQEIISFTDIVIISDTISKLTGVTRGLDAQPDPVTGLYGSSPTQRKAHAGGVICILSDNPQVWDKKTSKDEDESITGSWDFTEVPKSSGGDAVDDDDIPNYRQVLDLLTGDGTINRIVINGKAGETIAQGNKIYLKTSDGLWYKTSASASATSEGVQIGIAQGAGTTGNSIANGVLTQGVDSTQTSLTANTAYYLSDTAGAFSTTPGTKSVFIGYSDSTGTKLLFAPNFDTILTKGQKLAAAGAGGTPSASNLFETQFDTSNASSYTASTISFNSGTKTISDSANGFITAGFKQGTELNISGTSDNDGTVTIISVAAGAIVVAETLYTEAAGPSITLWTPKAGKMLRLDDTGKLPALDGSNLTNLPSQLPVYANGRTSRAGDSTGTQNIAHGLGVAPTIVRIVGVKSLASLGIANSRSDGTYNGTTTSTAISGVLTTTTSISSHSSSYIVVGQTAANNSLQASVTVDATNIVLTWTATGSPSNDSIFISWEANT